jgi:hypothetical protein
LQSSGLETKPRAGERERSRPKSDASWLEARVVAGAALCAMIGAPHESPSVSGSCTSRSTTWGPQPRGLADRASAVPDLSDDLGGVGLEQDLRGRAERGVVLDERTVAGICTVSVVALRSPDHTAASLTSGVLRGRLSLAPRATPELSADSRRGPRVVPSGSHVEF